METVKIPLIKKSSTFKIVIPDKVERTIRFLCEKVWNTEWSGVLFYTPTGHFEDGTLEIHCEDILPMDIGTATYTEFNMSPDVISYMAENPELLDCKTGLIHSHNNMSTFFSGTDTSTLQEEGAVQNHFVSLIVNNAGEYTAAITRKVKYKSTKELSYVGFEGPKSIPEVIEEEGEEIEYYYLNIVFENSPKEEFKYLSERLDNIKASKPIASYSPNTANVVNTGTPKTINYYSQPSLFTEVDKKEPKRMIGKLQRVYHLILE